MNVTWSHSCCRAFGAVEDGCELAPCLLVSPALAAGTCNAGGWARYSHTNTGLRGVWGKILKWNSRWAEIKGKSLLGTYLTYGAEKVKHYWLICERWKSPPSAAWLRLALCLRSPWESAGSAGQWSWLRQPLLVLSVQEQVPPGTGCLFPVLKEALTSKTGADTVRFLPCGYVASMQTDLFPGWNWGVKLPRLASKQLIIKNTS